MQYERRCGRKQTIHSSLSLSLSLSLTISLSLYIYIYRSGSLELYQYSTFLYAWANRAGPANKTSQKVNDWYGMKLGFYGAAMQVAAQESWVRCARRFVCRMSFVPLCMFSVCNHNQAYQSPFTHANRLTAIREL